MNPHHGYSGRRTSGRPTLRSMVLCIPAAFLVVACASGERTETPPKPVELVYPNTPRGTVVDDYHGTRVADPYRALESPDAAETQSWVAAQNALAQPWLEAIPQRAWIKQRLTQIWSYERFGVPQHAGDRWFYMRNDGQQNQSVLYVTDALDRDGRALIDPNSARSDATIALSRFEPSPDGKTLAYALSDGGTDWEIWKWKRVGDASDLTDELRHVKFWNVSWARDGSGVYYCRYPALPNGRGDDAGRPDIYFHKLGEPQSSDKRIFAITDHAERVPSPTVTDDGRFLIITISESTKTGGISVMDLSRRDRPVVPLFDRFDADYYYVGGDSKTLYFATTSQAPKWRIVAVDTARIAADAVRTVVPEADNVISDAAFVGGRLVVNYVQDARNVVKLFERDGKVVGDVALPGLGTATGFASSAKDTSTFFGFSNYLSPSTVLELDVSRNAVKPFRIAKLAASVEPYVTEQVFYKSKDGTRVPMFITRRKDMPRDGQQPVMLYGYGGFNVSATPAFRPAVLAWLEMGGVFAEANLRGGGEYGEAWHDAGTLGRKQNVFDDFIAAAEYLIAERYTSTPKLAIHGRSNGGLLVGAVMTQRPDLFGAALPGVGVLDMLRYHLASANARQWSGDYGLSENAGDFSAQYAYSPVHNVKEGVCYPPTLVTTAERDDRVVPWHSYKFAAALQHAQGCANPVLIRIETRAGHGAGKPLWMQIEDFADQWAFVAKALGMPTPASQLTPAPPTAPAR